MTAAASLAAEKLEAGMALAAVGAKVVAVWVAPSVEEMVE